MLQEAEKEPKTPEAEPDTAVVPSAITGLRHVSAPENRPPSSNPQLPPGQNICADCERLIVRRFGKGLLFSVVAHVLTVFLFSLCLTVSPRSDFYATHSHAVGGRQATSPRSNTPDDHSRLSSRLGDYPNTIPNQEGVTKCTECERVIVGVFVRIKDKNLHVECFKCSTCGTSLKNVGYYNINNKLYCDVHAKLAARTNPPAPNLVPITVPPGGKAPASAISTALATHSLPSPSPLSPKTNLAQPFQPSQDKETNLTSLQNLSINSDPNCLNKPNNLLSSATPLSYSKYLNKAGNYSTAPKPFASVSAPTSNQSFNTLPKTAPLSPIASAPAPASYSPVSSTGRLPAKPVGSVFKGTIAV
ncbi:PDZ and LIM domain protein Zasp-like Protein [Tribolium castaneum]|uniref:PDZ and LIM domain protein Zasp-like Protein n=1 Tax=Tribolium castaneum TaxID=7070 RepID=A0A139WH78_TRICA|nr:PDZ and LIM domain protein Zasp-like Protein [Tribolium castaneum]